MTTLNGIDIGYRGPVIVQRDNGDYPDIVIGHLGEMGDEIWMKVKTSNTGAELSRLRLPTKDEVQSYWEKINDEWQLKKPDEYDFDDLLNDKPAKKSKGTNNKWRIKEWIKFEDKDNPKSLYYHLLIIDYPAKVTEIEQDFTTVKNILKVSNSEVIRKIFLVGLKAILEENNLESVIFDQKSNARMRMLATIARNKQEISEMNKIYQALGEEGFREWCDETGHDADIFLQKYTYTQPKKNKQERVLEFLEKYLSDRQPHKTEVIKLAAEQAGIIDTEIGWNYIKTVASREGFTQEASYGYWQMT